MSGSTGGVPRRSLMPLPVRLRASMIFCDVVSDVALSLCLVTTADVVSTLAFSCTFLGISVKPIYDAITSKMKDENKATRKQSDI